MRLWLCGFEKGTIEQGIEWDVTQHDPEIGDLSISNTSKHSGRYALFVKNHEQCIEKIFSTEGVIKSFYRFYFRPAKFPTYIEPNNLDMVIQNISSAQYEIAKLKINHAGQLYFEGIAQYSPILELNKWHLIETHIDASNLESTIVQAKLNGSQFYENISNQSGKGLPKIIDYGSVYCDVEAEGYFDDIVINDSTGKSRNSWPGPIEEEIPNKKIRSGYNAFQKQYVRNSDNGIPPFKTPDRINRCW